MLSASAAFAQRSVTPNRATVAQWGSGNSIVSNQGNSSIDETSKTTDQKQPGRARPGEGNQVSLRVDTNTQTTINQTTTN